MKAYPLYEAVGREDIVHVVDLSWVKDMLFLSKPRGRKIKLPPDPYRGDETIKVTKKLIKKGFHHSPSISPSQDMVTDVVGYVGKGRGKGVGKKYEVVNRINRKKYWRHR